MKKLLASLLAVSMVLALASCGSKPQEPSSNGGTSTPKSNSSASTSTPPAGNDSEKTVEGKTVAFIPKLTGNAFFEVANTGAQEYAKDWGMTVDYIGSPNATAADQVSVINDAVAKGVDAICISTVDAAGVADALKAAQDAGIVVCTWDSDAAVSDRALMVSQGTPEVLGQMLVGGGGKGHPRPRGHVVHDNGQLHPVGNILVVLDEAGLAALVVVGSHMEQGVRAGVLGVEGQVHGGGGIVAACAGNDLHLVVHPLDAVIHGGDVLPDGHGGGFAGGAAHAHRVHPGLELEVNLLAEGVVVDIPVLVKGRNQSGAGTGKNGGSHRQNILSKITYG